VPGAWDNTLMVFSVRAATTRPAAARMVAQYLELYCTTDAMAVSYIRYMTGPHVRHTRTGVATTVLGMQADNGGETGGGGNNWPKRGGKYTDFEGGTSVAGRRSRALP